MNLFEKNNNNLNEKQNRIQMLVENKTVYPEINGRDAKNTMTLILSNMDKQEKEILAESATSADIAAFTPVLMPVVRTLYPRLIANELIGIQPLPTPSAYIYALTNNYATKPHLEKVELVIYDLDKEPTEDKNDDIGGETLVHKEGKRVAVTVKGTKKSANEQLGPYTVKAVYSNSTVFPKLFRNWSEADLSDEMRPDINYVQFSISKKVVEAQMRALHGEYTLELYQDLLSQHNIQADVELVNLMANEIQTDIDMQVVDFVNKNSRQVADWDAKQFETTKSNFTSVDVARELFLKIAKESSQIARQTYRGQAKTILCSSRVADMLSMLSGFVKGPVDTDITKAGVSTAFVGTIENRFRVIVDPYAEHDYVTVLYKGSDRHDAMGFFCPYIPLTLQKVANSQTGTYGIIAKTRFALTTIPGISDPNSNDRASLYATTFSVTNL